MAVITSPTDGMPNNAGARARVIQERSELISRIVALQDAMQRPDFRREVGPDQWMLLQIQLTTMQSYESVLEARLMKWSA